MLGSDRLAAAVRDHGKSLIIAGGKQASALRGYKKSLVLAGTALALVGAGSASAATTAGPAPAPPAARAHSGALPVLPFLPMPHSALAIAALVGTTTDGAAAPRAGAGLQAAAGPHVADALDAAGPAHASPARHRRLPLADRLMPVGTSGPQSWMPVNHAQVTNATTIVRQAMAMRMGVRSAVIAVATAMQESSLVNIDYGDQDSLGLFQQQPDCGWGTAAQVMNPKYAADAFLGALRQHQASDPSWARQPLWANAQAVQESAFPFAYAKWEAQAASLVRRIDRNRALTS